MILFGSGSVYNTSEQLQGRTWLTGTPLGVGLAIELFIHKIAFVSIWPNQQARWVLWMYSQDSLDIRYNKCKHDAHEQVSMHDKIINLHCMINKRKSGGSLPEIPLKITEDRSGVWSDASKGKNKIKHYHSQASGRHHIKGLYQKQITIMPQSDVWATSHKGLISKVNNNNATVGRLSDIT